MFFFPVCFWRDRKIQNQIGYPAMWYGFLDRETLVLNIMVVMGSRRGVVCVWLSFPAARVLLAGIACAD